MRQTLKVGITVLVVAAMTMSGLAWAQSSGDGSGEAVERLGEVIAPLVADGTLTQAQADAVAEFLVENGPRRGGHRRGPGPEAVAEFIGVSTDELRAAREAGESLADVAGANGVSVDSLIGFFVADAQEKLDAKVADGSLSQVEADEKLVEITERVTAMVNGDGGGPGRGPGRGGPGRGGPGGGTTDA